MKTKTVIFQSKWTLLGLWRGHGLKGFRKKRYKGSNKIFVGFHFWHKDYQHDVILIILKTLIFFSFFYFLFVYFPSPCHNFITLFWYFIIIIFLPSLINLTSYFFLIHLILNHFHFSIFLFAFWSLYLEANLSCC